MIKQEVVMVGGCYDGEHRVFEGNLLSDVVLRKIKPEPVKKYDGDPGSDTRPEANVPMEVTHYTLRCLAFHGMPHMYYYVDSNMPDRLAISLILKNYKGAD